MKEYIIKVVSYKRPSNNTCNLLLNTDFNWQVFVYSFDPYFDEYVKNYGEHVRPITEFDKANLAKKRQLVLDTTINEGYGYCIMLDDDIESIEFIDYPSRETTQSSLEDAVLYLIKKILENHKYVALSASYNASSDKSNKDVEDYKNICNNSIFNMYEYKNFKVKYNSESKCEDMEFTMDLILAGALVGRLKKLCMHNILQGGTTNDGLSYRFANTNRFVEEATYMINRYPEYKEVFEYDEQHFKMNTSKLKKLLKGCKNEN